MSETEQRQVDHLFLLIGKNPLPNAVAGELLCKEKGTVSLLFSAEVGSIKEKLKRHLESLSRKVEPKQVDESDPKDIWRGVRERMERHEANKSVGLNYTGGTKAMAVHAHRALEKYASEKRLKPSFSYLDARNLQMIFDPFNPESENRKHADVRAMVKMKIDTLINLHGWSYSHPPNIAPKLPKTAEALAKLYGKNRECTWHAWKNKVAAEFDSSKKVKHSLATLSSDTKLKDVLDALKDELSLSGDELDLSHRAFRGPKDFKEWIHGKWVEHHILDVLQKNADDCCINDCAQNIETKEVPFDIDVIAIRGYQLFAFSCGMISSVDMDEKKLKPGLKNKLFEAHFRAEQLGGDESCVALVCLHSTPSLIEKEMRQHGLRDRHVKVFGRSELTNMNSAVKQWINTRL